eukprot:gnl/TRDRNA2_/TRDRNA2_63179_c0_seq1.p1 gnl/TRDRNA2_/TRDRNA2_63179_c0~~gnl/TRDRNA2_/TRDRNA2_63179_c0_seq1.p1  ORF type:complete len:361 (+),score=49.72 gnl/TRDRNA2_/TRDRNA2_63179_c0_seq1:73-1083(+)
MHDHRVHRVVALAVYIHLCLCVSSLSPSCEHETCFEDVAQEHREGDAILMQLKRLIHVAGGTEGASDMQPVVDSGAKLAEETATDYSDNSIMDVVLDRRTWVAASEWVLSCTKMSAMAGVIAILIMSTDDILWLVPFMSSNKELGMIAAVTYFVTSLLAVFGAWGLSHAAYLVQDRYKNLPVQTVMGLTSALLLFGYAVYLYVQWHAEQVKEPSEEADNPQEADPEEKAKELANSQSIDHDAAVAEERTFRQLLIISIVGSLDKLAVYFSMMIVGVLAAPRLLLSQIICCSLVLVIAMAATYWTTLVRVVEKIPLWCIVGVLSIWSVLTVLMAWGK